MKEGFSGDRHLPRLCQNLEFLAPRLRAPLPLAPNSPVIFRRIFYHFLARGMTPPEVLEPAVTSGGSLVHAFQETILSCNRLIAGHKEGLASAVRRIIWSCQELLGARNTAYALEQAVEGSSRADCSETIAEFDRMKNLMEPLERRLDELGLPGMMDGVRFGILQVQLDELYDRVSLLLQRFYHVLKKLDAERRIAGKSPVGPLFSDFSAPDISIDKCQRETTSPSARSFSLFAGDLARAVTREIIPDQILGQGAGKGRENTGLLHLLPEFEGEFL